MENSSLTKSILETMNDSKGNSLVSSTTSSSEGGLGSLFSVSISTWIIIILIVAFLGFYILYYLGKGPQDIVHFFKSIISKFTGEVFTSTTKGTSEVGGAIAATAMLDANQIKDTHHDMQGKKADSSVGNTSISNAIPQTDIAQNNTLNKLLNKTNAEKNIGQTQDYVADDSISSIQKNQSKSGFCYIGEEKGVRSCMRVSENDKCMSGDIFPTREICINPSLRV
jgi:hypothetical protein